MLAHPPRKRGELLRRGRERVLNQVARTGGAELAGEEGRAIRRRCALAERQLHRAANHGGIGEHRIGDVVHRVGLGLANLDADVAGGSGEFIAGHFVEDCDER